MSKPVILAVYDDISVLEAVGQDLRRQYGQKSHDPQRESAILNSHT